MKNKDNQDFNTEEAILRAAEEEFLDKGFAGARTVSIAEKAGVTHALLHYYFRTKDALYERILKEKIDQLAGTVIAIFGDESLPLVERIVKGAGTHFDMITEMPKLPRFIISELTSGGVQTEVLRRYVASKASPMLEKLQKDIDEGASQGICERVPAMMLVMDILALNIFAFVALPMIDAVPSVAASPEEFLKARKEENLRVILKRLSR